MFSTRSFTFALAYTLLVVGASSGGCARGIVNTDGDGDTDVDTDTDTDGDGDGGSCGDSRCSGGEWAASCPEDCPASCGDGICTHDETTDTCPGDCPQGCGDGECSSDEDALNCPDDCPASCGDDQCTHDEGATGCPEDCPATCGDGACTHDETTDTCPSDCPPGCGDGMCNGDESASTCPADCDAECGDGFCTHDEGAERCPEDCPADCGDSACTHDETALSCPGDCPSICGDGACTHAETAAGCPVDCPDECGDGVCTGEETARDCEDDCPADCGDGACTHDESAASCAADCPAVCGDSVCTHDETAADCADDCPADCGDGACTHDEDVSSCPGDCPAVCGDRECTHAETAAGCPGDCPARCGDGACTHAETAAGCPADCPARCGDGACTHAEDAASCPAECPPICGDGACTHDESPMTCPGDCRADCGDGACTHDESALTCPGDCPARCGDGSCTHAETACSCAADCTSRCGDGCCTHAETACTCAGDCGARCGDGCCTHAETPAACPADCGGVCGDGVVDDDEECDDGNTARCDGCSPDCTVELAWSRGALLLRDSGDVPAALTTLLTSEGFRTVARNNGTGTTSSDVDELLAFPMVVFYNYDREITAAEESALDQYVQCGGVLLVTGYDSMGHPTDTRLARVARVTTSGDYVGHTSCTVTDDSHPATTGPYGDYAVGSAFTVVQSDHDNVVAGGASRQLVSVDAAAKLTWAGDVGSHHGQVYFWNGNSGFNDWTAAGAAQNIFLNIMSWHLHSIGIVHDQGTTPAALTTLLRNECFPQESLDNRTQTYSSSFWWLHRHPMVIFFNYNRGITAAEESALIAYVNNGGTLLVTGYDSMGSPTDTRLANACRVITSGDGPFSTSCRVTDAAHPALRGPYGTFGVGTTFTASSSDHDNVRADAALGSTQLVSVDTAAKLTYATDLGLDGTVYYWNGNSGMGDWTAAGTAQDIFLNLLASEVPRATTCGHGGADFYALPYDFYQFDMLAANLLRRAVSHGFAATPVVGAVSEGVDTTGATHASNPGGPYAGEFNATVGALRQAGHPAGSIITLATPAEASARIADIDVLLFMEQETGDPAPAPWIPIVTSLLAARGRVVVTTGQSGTAAFINGLGIFGAGTATSCSAPFTTAADDFWTGIVHPGYLNATGCWNWAGAGLTRLAWDPDDVTDLTVWGYDVD
jgi:hypothetical protein